jgi:hypothetical protein
MFNNKIKQFLNRSLDIAWAIFVLALPFTSFPLISHLAGGTMVAPLSFIPLLWILCILVIPFIFKRGRIPFETTPLFILFFAIILSSAFAFFLNIPTYDQAQIFPEIIRSLVTLLIGFSFYFVTLVYLSDKQKLHQTMLWINIGGCLIIFWCLLQGYFIFVKNTDYPQWLYTFQKLFSTGSLYDRRMTGFAYEPSWLAHELNMVYIPIWLAMLLTGHSSFSFRIFKLPVETSLLICSLLILFVSSRVGMLTEFLVFAYLLLIACTSLGKWLYNRWMLRSQKQSRLVKTSIYSLVFIVVIIFFLGAAFGTVYLVGEKVDPRFSVFYTINDHFSTLIKNPYDLANYLQIGERYDRWIAGWQIFGQHPIFGVGFGVSGFYLLQTIPSQAWDIPEIAKSFVQSAVVPNLKSFWFRLLAETGILGFSAFVTWLYLQFRTGRLLLQQHNSLYKTIGWTGVIVVISFLVEGLSIDSFALPYLWFMMGTVTAAGTLARRDNLTQI